jgi:hypothetical protein
MKSTKQTHVAFPYPPISGELNSGDTFLKIDGEDSLKPIYTLQELPDFDIWGLVNNETGGVWSWGKNAIDAFGSYKEKFSPYRKAIEKGGVVEISNPDSRVITAINKARDKFPMDDAVKIASFMGWTYSCTGPIDKKAINRTLDELVLNAVKQYQNNIKNNKPLRKIHVGTGRIALIVLFWDTSCIASFTFGVESRSSFSYDG